MKEITLTSDLKPLASQPDGPWQAGAGGFSVIWGVKKHVWIAGMIFDDF